LTFADRSKKFFGEFFEVFVVWCEKIDLEGFFLFFLFRFGFIRICFGW